MARPPSAVSRAAHMQLHRVAFDERQVLQGIAVPDRPNQICKPLNGPPPRSVLDIPSRINRWVAHQLVRAVPMLFLHEISKDIFKTLELPESYGRQDAQRRLSWSSISAVDTLRPTSSDQDAVS